jgi:hypothetical protein
MADGLLERFGLLRRSRRDTSHDTNWRLLDVLEAAEGGGERALGFLRWRYTCDDCLLRVRRRSTQ